MTFWIIYFVCSYLFMIYLIRRDFPKDPDVTEKMVAGLIFLFSPFTVVFGVAFIIGEFLTMRKP